MISASFQTGFEKDAFSYSAGKRFIRSLGGKGAARGYRRAATEAGPESFLGEALSLPFGKKTREKVKSTMWKYVSRPALKADTWAGSKIQKVPGMKGLFTAKEQVPLAEKGLHRDIERSSALAPIVKMRNIAVPIFAGIGIEKAVNKLRGVPEEQPQVQDYAMMDQKTATVIQDADLREKIASTMLQLNGKNKEHEKRAQATKLLYKQAELGLAALPSTYDEYEQKLASLVRQDLAVLEKALELTAGNAKFGELSGSDLSGHDAAATFQSEVLG